MARDRFLEACSRELFVHLKPKAFENLDAMAKEADLFAEARGGVFSCVNKGQRDHDNKGAVHSKPEIKPSGKPEIKCGICGKRHLTIRCYKNPDRKQAYSAEIASGSSGNSGSKGSYTDSSVVAQGMHYRNDDAPNRGRGFGRRPGAGRALLAVAVSPTGHLVVPGTKSVFVKRK